MPMEDSAASYRRLDPQKIIETIEALQARIAKRFPDAGLGKVVAELHRVGTETAARSHWIQRPHLPLRLAAALLSLTVIALFILMLIHIRQFQFSDYTNFIQAFEASISAMVFIGAAILFFLSWETRIKRRRAMKAVHELRALAHIVDMHQLTKDPESYFAPSQTNVTRRRMT